MAAAIMTSDMPMKVKVITDSLLAALHHVIDDKKCDDNHDEGILEEFHDVKSSAIATCASRQQQNEQ